MEIIGFNGSHEESEEIWRRNALLWQRVGIPWRPSEGDIEIYRRLSSDKVRGRVLILGATPELRDLVSQEGNSLYVVADSSLEMLSATSGLLRHAEPRRETWMKSNWSDLVFFLKGDFDLIIGDMIWWVLSIEAQKAVRDSIHALLKPDGRFVARFRLQNESLALCTIQDIFVRGLHRRHEAGEMELAQNEMLSDLYDKVANPLTRRLSCSSVRDLLTKEASTHTIEADKDFLLQASKRTIGADWTVQTISEIMAILNPRFRVQEEQRAEDYNSKWYPILSLSKHIS